MNFLRATFIAAALSLHLGAMGRDEVVITNQSLILESTGRSAIRTFFCNPESNEYGRKPSVVFVLPQDHATSRSFAWNILNFPPHHFRDNCYSSGQQIVQSETALVAAVLSTPGSIGFVSDFIANSFIGRLNIICPKK